jgi:CoA:oxalate CoA-transferase
VSKRGPLYGVRVVEIAQLASGPYCCALLASLGASVHKIEPPAGDLSRTLPPFIDGESAFFRALNHEKTLETVDLKSPAGRARGAELLSSADVLVHNLSAGAATRLGLDTEELRGTYPGLVVCAISAFGSHGDEAHRVGVDLIFQAESGLMSVTGLAEGPPFRAGTNIPDLFAGVLAALGVLAGLRERDASGMAPAVSLSLIASTVALQSTWFTALSSGLSLSRMGNDSPFSAPNGTFRAADVELAISIVGDRQWASFCNVLELESDDPRFATNDLRCRNRIPLRKAIEDKLAAGDAAYWVESLVAAGLPAGLIRTYDEVVAGRPSLFARDGQTLLTSPALQFERG